MRFMPAEDQVNLTSVKKASMAIGNFQRALWTLEEPRKTIRIPKNKKRPRKIDKVVMEAPAWVFEDDAYSNVRQETKKQ